MARAAPRRLATTHAGREEAVGVEVRARDARLGDHAVERGLLQPQGQLLVARRGALPVWLVEHRPLVHPEAVEVRRALGGAPEDVSRPPQTVQPTRLAAVELAWVVVPTVRVSLPASTLPEQRLNGRGSAYQHARPRRPSQQDPLLDEVVLEDEVEDGVALRAGGAGVSDE